VMGSSFAARWFLVYMVLRSSSGLGEGWGSTRCLRQCSLAWWRSSGSSGLVHHQWQVSEEDGWCFGAPRGGGHWAGIYRAISGMLRKDYSIYSISNLHLILMISGWIRRKGKILIGYNLVISLPSICHCRVGKGKGPGGGGL
jgi:hypothetical protein